MKMYEVGSLKALLDLFELFAKESWLLFRGQENDSWSVDSKFVRSILRNLSESKTLEINTIRNTIYFHQYVIKLMQHKRNTYNISEGMKRFGQENPDIDLEFEILKLFQQYPEKESSNQKILGTNIVDWSYDPLVALYFAVNNTQDLSLNKDASIHIYNSINTPNVLQVKKVEELYSLMNGISYQNCLLGTLPIIFHPKKLIKDKQSSNQKAIYVAQMDFRYDLIDIWLRYEKETGREVVSKIIIPANLKEDCRGYLYRKGYNKFFIYPELYSI